MTQRMIWVHGWGMSSDVWQGFPESLPEYEHEMIDFGVCETPESFRDELSHTIGSSADGPCNIVAWSMGGILTLDLLLTERFAAQIDNVLLIGATFSFANQDRRLGWPPRVLERMKKRMVHDPEETLIDFKTRCFSEAERVQLARKDLPLPLNEIQPDLNPIGLVAGLDYLQNTDLRPHVEQKAGLPNMLWIHGEDDLICPVGNLDFGRYWEKNGIMKKVVLPAAGHVPFLTQRQQVLELMKEFFHK